jgi:5-methylcytosine-specific restriction endonuclease McrA
VRSRRSFPGKKPRPWEIVYFKLYKSQIPDYQKLREQVLRRDSWRCQLCGSMISLEVHHKQFRSHSGGDQEDNLITLCFDCHAFTHGDLSGC